MNDVLARLLAPASVWRAGGWDDPAQCRAAAVRAARHLRSDGPVIPLFNDSGLFLVGMAACLIAGARYVFLSDRTPSVLDRLRVDHGPLRVVTDGDQDQLPFAAEEVLGLTRAVGPVPDFAPDLLGGGVEPDTTVLIAYTSGSTGVPKAYVKTWSALVAEAAMLGRGLRLADHGAHVISTVPLHHMYGFSYGVFGPLTWGMSIDAQRPVYPKDLARVLEQAPGPSWVVTTPTQLRAYAESQLPLPKLAGFICSAAPLPPALAEVAERRLARPVIETYGSTETGAVAWRRPTESLDWTAYDAVTVTADEGMRVHAPHLPIGGQRLDDCVEVLDARRFRVVGRSSDLIKVAGKRASLADLNARLRDIEGVDDAAFFLPGDQDDPAMRLCAFVVSPQGNPGVILARLREQMDPVFLPRPLILVERLPRSATGKLPSAALAALWEQRSTGDRGA